MSSGSVVEWPGIAAAAFFLPGLVNGYGTIERQVEGIARAANEP